MQLGNKTKMAAAQKALTYLCLQYLGWDLHNYYSLSHLWFEPTILVYGTLYWTTSLTEGCFTLLQRVSEFLPSIHCISSKLLFNPIERNRSFLEFQLKAKIKSLKKKVSARIAWSVVAERSSLPYSSSGVSSRMWVRIPAVTLVSLSKTLNHNCFSPPRG